MNESLQVLFVLALFAGVAWYFWSKKSKGNRRRGGKHGDNDGTDLR